MTHAETIHLSALAAVSLDGRAFRFNGTSDSPFTAGGFVTLTESDGRVQVGQIDELSFPTGGSITGSGKILGIVDPQDGHLESGRSSGFAAATIKPADAETIERVYVAAGATLRVGSIIGSDGIDARLLPHRFNRHTFWCGQSGSGKTYALGVLLEQLLVHTDLPMVIFDPNADFVRMRELYREVASDEERELASRDIRILRPGAEQNALLVRFTALPMAAKAAVLRLDPLIDRAEYNALLHIENTLGSQDVNSIIPELSSRTDVPAAQALSLRIENLRLADWGLWAGRREAVTEVLESRPNATVLDLGGFAFPEEYLVVAMAVLDDLWAKREQRRPILIVIDEAHNLCSPENDSPLHRAVRERITQIAAEGRKFGLWLLLSTQRPSKIHPSIISQCDNLALMKMSSPVDLDELATIFGFAPRALLAQSPLFRQGEALFAGGFVPAPTLIKVRDRLTHEGGSDVKVPTRTSVMP
jgi:DNA helicase HerA-like ATPase